MGEVDARRQRVDDLDLEAAADLEEGLLARGQARGRRLAALDRHGDPLPTGAAWRPWGARGRRLWRRGRLPGSFDTLEQRHPFTLLGSGLTPAREHTTTEASAACEDQPWRRLRRSLALRRRNDSVSLAARALRAVR